ncbi:hypothetical protein FQR65_LT10625 [Abscondita terminalis]|nr:hypothetical protein FQR65_LT10625 [Abscondita terminalis]
MFDIQGKVAIVSGGASGIGLSIVEQLLKNEAKGVTIADINQEIGEQVAQNLINKYGTGKVIFVKVNVTLRNEFQEVFETTVKTFGNLDILVNSAGIVKDLIWEEEIAVNLGGTITGTYYAFENYLPKYKSGAEGVIINVSSITALGVYSHAPIYSATKSGVMAFSRCYGSSTHYNRKQNRVMTLCPGFTDTPILRPHSERLLDKSFNKFRDESTADVIYQTPDHVAETAIKMIREGTNGSVWVVENGKAPYEVKFLDREDCKK